MLAKHNVNKANVCVRDVPFVPSTLKLKGSSHLATYNPRLGGYSTRTHPVRPVSFASPKAKQALKVKLSMASQPQTRITLPSTLPRPTPKSIDIRALRESCPEVKDVAPSYLRQQLSMMAPQCVQRSPFQCLNILLIVLYSMLAGLESTHILSPPSSQLPQGLQVIFGDAVSIPNVAPTHFLALTSSHQRTASGKPKYTLFPVHQLPFAAHCSSFPSLPKSSTATPAGNRSPTASLPVVPLSIPSVETFTLFQSYVYVKDSEALRTAFLPSGWALSANTIMQRAMAVKGFHANAVAFGMVDGAMYDVIEDCWAEVLRALQQVSRSTTTS